MEYVEANEGKSRRDGRGGNAAAFERRSTSSRSGCHSSRSSHYRGRGAGNAGRRRGPHRYELRPAATFHSPNKAGKVKHSP